MITAPAISEISMKRFLCPNLQYCYTSVKITVEIQFTINNVKVNVNVPINSTPTD